MNAPARRIAHLDMDAFYASVELLRQPQLRGLPVVVGGRRANGVTAPPMPLRDYQGRGVVTTSTYEARALGVHSGMAIMRAARHAPDALLLPPSFDAYRHYSTLFKAAVVTIAPLMENRGIDEIYLDLTDLDTDSRALGLRLKAAVREATGLSCSLGIAANKLLAKIGSELDKPDGLTLLGPEDVPRRVWPLPVAKINGIGPKATRGLQALGIRTIGELAVADAALLEDAFGARFALWLRESANGVDRRPVVTESAAKSLSRETTFERDLDPRDDRSRLSTILVGLCERLAQDLAAKGAAARTVGIKLRYADFRTVTRELTLAGPVAAVRDILAGARECLRRVPLDRRLRLLGVRAGSLSAPAQETAFGRQAELPFGDEDPRSAQSRASSPGSGVATARNPGPWAG